MLSFRKIFTFSLDGKINGHASHVSTGFQWTNLIISCNALKAWIIWLRRFISFLKREGVKARWVCFSALSYVEVIVTFFGLDETKLCLLLMPNYFGLKLHSEKSPRNRSHFKGSERPGDNFNSIRPNGCENRFEILLRIDQWIGGTKLGEEVGIWISDKRKSVGLTYL